MSSLEELQHARNNWLFCLKIRVDGSKTLIIRPSDKSRKKNLNFELKIYNRSTGTWWSVPKANSASNRTFDRRPIPPWIPIELCPEMKKERTTMRFCNTTRGAFSMNARKHAFDNRKHYCTTTVNRYYYKLVLLATHAIDVRLFCERFHQISSRQTT